MSLLLDTSVAIHLRDRTPSIQARLVQVDQPLVLSIIGRVELENGVYREADKAASRRRALDALVMNLRTLDFAGAELTAYCQIVEALGYSRRRVTDRMIAATAIANGMTLATTNAQDVSDIPGLVIEDWSQT